MPTLHCSNVTLLGCDWHAHESNCDRLREDMEDHIERKHYSWYRQLPERQKAAIDWRMNRRLEDVAVL